MSCHKDDKKKQGKEKPGNYLCKKCGKTFKKKKHACKPEEIS